MNWIERKTLGLFVKTNGILSKKIFGGLGHIFMLHRVLPENLRNEYSLNKDLAITPEYLEECIQYFISKGYTFISLDELTQILVENKKPPKKFVCFTLDDGYKDNLTYGFPIFSKYKIPVTIYITNCFPNNTAILWWYLLEKVIAEKNEFTLQTTAGPKTYYWQNSKEGNARYYTIRDEIRRIHKEHFRPFVLTSFGMSEDEIRHFNQPLFLDWAEIRQLSGEPLVTIGAHTMNHLSMASLSVEEMKDEVLFSKQEIEQYVQQEVQHFAYPYGGKDDAYSREYQTIKQLGFKTGTLNVPGNIFHTSKQHLEALPRMPLGNSTSRQQLDYILNGINHFSNNGFHKTMATD